MFLEVLFLEGRDEKDALEEVDGEKNYKSRSCEEFRRDKTFGRRRNKTTT